MTDEPVQRRLSAQAFAALLLAVFVVAFGYGFLLPILPSLLREIAGVSDSAAISRHAGLSSAVYALALFLLAPLWGRFADRHGRRCALLLGLGGLAALLALSATAANLPTYYLGRFLSGAFAAAIAPATFALVGEAVPSEAQRAHRFAFLTIANSLGFLVGPVAGGLAGSAMRDLPAISEGLALRMPFLVSSGFAVSALVFASFVVRGRDSVSAAPTPPHIAAGPKDRQILVRLLAASFTAATALGALEVGLSLLGTQTMAMPAGRIGLMFAECMIVMLSAQALVFSPLVKIERTRWVVAPALAFAAIGLALLPVARSDLAMAAAVAAIAGGAGAVGPVATYWISRTSGERQGAGLGRDTAAQNLGQASGAAATGLLFSATFVPNAAFILAALVVLVGSIMSIRLARLLLPPAELKSSAQPSQAP